MEAASHNRPRSSNPVKAPQRLSMKFVLWTLLLGVWPSTSFALTTCEVGETR